MGKKVVLTLEFTLEEHEGKLKIIDSDGMCWAIVNDEDEARDEIRESIEEGMGIYGMSIDVGDHNGHVVS